MGNQRLITSLARGLVTSAAARWPDHLQDSARREWLAEIAVLSTQRRYTRMLRYALSLATHPSPRPELTTATRLWYAIRVVVVAPIVIIVIAWAAIFLSNVVHVAPPGVDAALVDGWLPLLLLCLGGACGAAILGRAWAPRRLGAVATVLVAAGPGLAGSAYLLSLPNIASRDDSDVVFLFFSAGFAALLYAVVRTTRSGHRRRAWILGTFGAFVLADLAVMAAGLTFPVPPGHVCGFAPLWLPGLLTNGQLGAYPGIDQVFGLSDTLLGVPQVLMVLSGWALGAGMGRPDPALHGARSKGGQRSRL